LVPIPSSYNGLATPILWFITHDTTYQRDCVLFGSFGVVGYVSSKIPTDVLHTGLKRNATLLHTSRTYPSPKSPPVATAGPGPPWGLGRRAMSALCIVVALTPGAARLRVPLGAWAEYALRAVGTASRGPPKNQLSRILM